MLHKDSIAIADFKKCTELDVSSKDAFIGLGDAYVDAKKYTEAVTAFEKALILDPKNGELTDKKALALVFADRRQDACATFDQAIQLGYSMAEVHKETYCKKDYK